MDRGGAGKETAAPFQEQTTQESPRWGGWYCSWGAGVPQREKSGGEEASPWKRCNSFLWSR